MYLKESAVIALIAVAIIPFTGFLVNFVISGILGFLLGLVSRSGKLYMFFANRLTFIGVMWHELSHALFAFLTGAKVERIELYHREDDRLGCVSYRARGIWPLRCIQHSLSSCAPVVMGIVALLGITAVVSAFELPVWAVAIAVYLFISIMVHMDMSPQDLKQYVKGVPFLLVVFFIIAYVCLLNDPDMFVRIINNLGIKING